MTQTIKTEQGNPEELLLLGPFALNPEWKVTVSNNSDAVGVAELFVEFDSSLNRFVVVSLSVKRSGEGTELTGATLRDMRISEAVQTAALHHIWSEGTGSATTNFNGVDYIDAATQLSQLPPVNGRTTDDDALHATVAYRIAQFSGAPVLRTISEALDTSQSTAKRLISRAKEIGFLERSAPGDG